MNEKEQYEGIQHLFEKLNQKVSNLKSDLKKNSKSARRAAKEMTTTLSLLIDEYELEYVDDDPARVTLTVNKFKEQLSTLKIQMKSVLNAHKEVEKKEESKKKKTKQTTRKANQMGAQELIQIGDDLQNDAIDRLLDMDKDLNHGNQMIVDANAELMKQKETLLDAHDDLHGIESTMKRAQKHISYFSREFYSDKFTRIMVLAIFLVLVAIVGIVIFKKVK